MWFEYVSSVLLWIAQLRALAVVAVATLTSQKAVYIPAGVRAGRAPQQPSQIMPPFDYYIQLVILAGITTLLVLGGIELNEKRSADVRWGRGICGVYFVPCILLRHILLRPHLPGLD